MGFEERLMKFVACRVVEYERCRVESRLQSLAVTELTRGTVDWLKLHVDGPVKVKGFIAAREL